MNTTFTLFFSFLATTCFRTLSFNQRFVLTEMKRLTGSSIIYRVMRNEAVTTRLVCSFAVSSTVMPYYITSDIVTYRSPEIPILPGPNARWQNQCCFCHRVNLQDCRMFSAGAVYRCISLGWRGILAAVLSTALVLNGLAAYQRWQHTN